MKFVNKAFSFNLRSSMEGEENNMKKKKLLIGTILASAVLGLSACGGDQTPPDVPPIVEAEECSVTFETSGGSKVDGTKVKNGEKVNQPTDPIREGYTFGGWYRKPSCLEVDKWDFTKNNVTADITLYAKWTANKYTVTFKIDGEVYKTQSVEYDKAPKEEKPEREGHTFNGWYTDELCSAESKFDFKSGKVKGETTLYGKWVADVVKHQVTFNSDGGSAVESQEVIHGQKAQRPVSPTKEGYIFVGWYTDSRKTVEFDFVNGVITKDTILYAKWEASDPEVITVTFNSKGGSEVAPITNIESGSKITKPADPVREGYVFVGWFKDTGGTLTEEFNFAEESITGSMVLFAKWELAKYMVTFDSDGGSAVESQEIENGSKAHRPVSPTKEGYLFLGWYVDEAKTIEFDFVNGVITKDITLYAKWEASNPDVITVTFNSKGGSEVAPITNIESGSKITKPADPVREGYVFVGWFKDTAGTLTEEFNFAEESITGSMVLYAKWEVAKYTVTFNSDGGSAVQSQVVEHGQKAVRVSPTKEGYLFLGWYVDEAKTIEFDFVNGVITKDITLYAKWEEDSAEVITVTFNSKGGSEVAPITNIESGSKITKPVDPEREGFTFIGWYKDTGGELTEEFNFETEVITESIVLFAKWEEIHTYSVTYVINGHGVQPDAVTGVTALPAELPALTAEGFRFEGWYTDNTTFQHQVEAGQEIAEDTTLYAKWVQLTPYEAFLALGNVSYQNEFKDLTQPTPNLLDAGEMPTPGDIYGSVVNANKEWVPYDAANSVSVTENGLYIKDESGSTTNAFLYLGDISFKKVDVHLEIKLNQVAGKWTILGLVNDLEGLSPVVSVRSGTDKTLGYKVHDKEDATNGLAYVANQTIIVNITLDSIHNKVSFKLSQGTKTAEFNNVELSIPVSTIYGLSFGTAASASRSITVEKVAVRTESYGLEEFKTALTQQFDAFYSSFNLETEYTQNGAVLTQAYNDGKAAITAAETEEAVLEAITTAVAAMNAVESDAMIVLNAKKEQVKTALETLRDENVANYTYDQNKQEFEELFNYALENLQVTSDEAWIDSILQETTERLNYILTDEQFFEEYKNQLISNLYEEFKGENYTFEENSVAYNEAFQTLQEALAASTNKEEADAAAEACRNSLAAIKTDSVVLEEAKTAAAEELQSFGDVSQITDETILAQIEAARTNGLEKIAASNTLYEVETALNEAKATITTQIEAASMTLEEAIERAKNDLADYVNTHPYSDHETVQAALTDGNTNIEAATTNAEALQACSDAKAAIELIISKLNAIEDLTNHKEELKSMHYLEAAKAVFEEGFDDLVATIQNATDLDSVAAELEAAKNALSEKEQDAVNLELADRTDFNLTVLKDDPKTADFAAYAKEVGKGKKPTANQVFGEFFKITTVGTTSTKNSTTEMGMSTKASIWEFTTTTENAELTILYYSTSSTRVFTLKGPDGNPFGDGTANQAAGVYEANSWGKNVPHTIQLGAAGTYTMEFDANEHKLTSVTLTEKKPQVVVAKVNALYLEVPNQTVVAGTDVSSVFTNAQVELEVPGQEDRVMQPITEGLTIVIRFCETWEEVTDLTAPGDYDIEVYYGTTATQYNSYRFMVTVTAE